MISAEDIAKNFSTTFSADGTGDNYSSDHFSGLTLGVVVDTDDPLETGRLRIFCPSLNDNPKKIQHLPWASYVTPFAGSISNQKYFRGADSDNAVSEGSLHYGFWSIPEMGAHVLVGCIDGDPRRRFWIGCIPEHQQANTIHHGRYKWKDGEVDGPLTGTSKPMQPLYDNSREAFNNDSSSPEFRSRVAEYQTSAVSEDVGQIPNSKMRESLDQQNSQIVDNNPDTWEHAAMGAHGYDWSGFKELGGFMSSRVFGWSTPGMHAFTMDDRPFNSRMRLRTTAGHQILMDDTNERIYISTYNGKNYIEMDANGNIDCYSQNRISLHSEKDMNFTTEGTYRVFARDGIHMFAGDNDSGAHTDNNVPYDIPTIAPPIPGEIRIHSTTSITNLSQGDIRNQSYTDTYTEVGGNFYGKTDKSYFNEVKDNINVVTDSGSYNADIASDLNENVGRDSKRFSEGNSSIASNGTNEIESFQGSIEAGARDGITMKTATGTVAIESNGYDGGGGYVKIKTPDNEIDVGNNGIKIASAIAATIAAATGVSLMVDGLLKSKIKSPPINRDSIPINRTPTENDIGMEPGPHIPLDPITGDPLPLPWVDDYTNPDDTTPTKCRQSITIDEATLVAYNAGFRGQDLVIAVAVAMAESNLTTLSHKKVEGDIFSENVGIFNIKTLSEPSECTGLEYRDNRDRQLENPNTNAQIAYKIFSEEYPAGEWSEGKWASIGDGRAESYFSRATEAVERFSNKVIKLQNSVIGAMNTLEDRLFDLTDSLNDILDKTDTVFRIIDSTTNMYNMIKDLTDAHSNDDPIGSLLGSVKGAIGPYSDQIELLITNHIMNMIPPEIMGIIAGVQGALNTLNSALNTLSAVTGLASKTVLDMNNMLIDLDAPLDINLRTPIFPISQIGLVTQYNVATIAINAIVGALADLGASISVPLPLPMPFPPILPIKIPIPDIPKLKLPKFENPIVSDLLKNNSMPAIKDTLKAKESEWRNSIKDKFTEQIDSAVATFDGTISDITDRIPKA